jgi:DNA primase
MDAAQEVKSRLDVADIVGEYLPLRPAGVGSFKANCPFHNEKTPSFYVNRPRQSWHCFGCDKGGDLISFVMAMEGLEFPDALQLLAQKAGVTLPAFNPEASTERKRLQEVNEMAAKFFRHYLLNAPEAEAARAYVAKRGIDDLTGDVWKIGYAPEGWSGLTEALAKRGVTESEMIRAGLAIQGQRGAYDRFRGRVMFAISDVHGHVVGFTGRILVDDKEQAKYVNTPETPVYKKSQILYGLDKAKGEMRRQDLAVIVEGNMDVLSSHQFNITNVVACSGTALTAEQLGLIKRFTTNLAIAFDADAAGGNATLRGLDLARKMDFSLKIIILPPEAGKDPDDAVRKDPELWRKAIADAVPVIEWLYRRAFRGRQVHRPEDKKEIAADLLPEFRRIASPIERDAWLRRLAQDLDVSENSLREASTSLPAPSPVREALEPRAPSAAPSPKKAEKSAEEKAVDRVRAILLLKPELVDLAAALAPAYPWAHTPEESDLGYLAALADRDFPVQTLDGLRRELEPACTWLRRQSTARRRAELEHAMRDAERSGDEARISEIIVELSTLQ